MTKLNPPLTHFEEPLKWEPEPYMKRAVKWLLEHAAGGLLLDPGLRKTSITLAAWKILLKKNLGERMLVIAPLKPCYLVWPLEIQKWADFNHLRVEILHGPKKEEALARDADVYVINPEGLEWLLDARKIKVGKRVKVIVDVARFKKFGFDTLVIDELSKFKHTQSIRFKALKQVLKTFSRRWGLTGSPAARHLIDLFGQVYMLDLGRSLGAYITHYRTQYFTPGFDGFSWVLQEGAEEKIYERLAPLMLRMNAEEYITLPKEVAVDVMVELDGATLARYLQLEKKLITELDGKVLTAPNSGSKIAKLRQIASGAVYIDQTISEMFKAPRGDREILHVHDEKIDALRNLVEELQGQPLLVAYDFQHSLARLRKEFGDVPVIGKGTKGKELVDIERRWNRGEVPLMFGHPMSMGHGLNLQGGDAHHLAWFDLNYDFELYDQFNRRVRRSGNKNARCFVYRIIARGTIDELIVASLSGKNQTQQRFFEGLRRLSRSRK